VEEPEQRRIRRGEQWMRSIYVRPEERHVSDACIIALPIFILSFFIRNGTVKVRRSTYMASRALIPCMRVAQGPEHTWTILSLMVSEVHKIA